ncbi:MAG: DUF3611 family protein [Coleofasciculus sp. S288]|nr:DUF3611 family protein [Coleofasciculus sp. S288]
MNMQTKPESLSLTPTIEEISNNFRFTGWISFWLQLGLGVVCGISLLFAWSGRTYGDPAYQGIGISMFWAVCAIIALGAGLYWDIRYTRIARGLRNLNPELRPHKTDTARLVRLGLIVSLVGMLLNLLGAGSGIGVLVSKAVSMPPGVAITDPNKMIRALDVFATVANVTGIAAHFVGAIASLWLLDRVYRH